MTALPRLLSLLGPLALLGPLTLLGPLAPIVLADEQDDREAVSAQVEYLSEAHALSGMDIPIAAGSLIAEFYANRNFAPAWTDPARVAELITVIEGTADEGLDPADYYADAVAAAYAQMLRGPVEPAEMAATDILLTESLIRVAYHQLFGKVDPSTLDPNWNFARDLDGVDPAAALQELIDSASLAGQLTALTPRGWLYNGLKTALARYREIQAAGGWPEVPDGATLRPGAGDPRLAVLARRLAVTGDLTGDLTGDPAGDLTGDPAAAVAAATSAYDARLEQAVRRFQQRHGLAVDGVIGPATLRALNVPVAERVRQIELSLERARWVMRGLADDFVIVNIAGFEAYLVHGREISWQTRVQVGQFYRQTPIFRDEIRYLVFNPTWTVPHSIATRDILPQLQQNAGYLSQRGFTVRDRQGEIVDAAGIDWSSLSQSNFPYTLVQGPGPGNALGRVKFMFPNEHAVYLHDTPSQSLFASPERAFSSGCIRVENPLELAELLLGPDWSRERIQGVLDGGEVTTVPMPEPLPVLLLYWTADVRADGTVAFFGDVYERDQAVAAALDEPFRFY